jgi:hypothetical protein
MSAPYGEPRDRFNKVYQSTLVNGVDFIEVLESDPNTLRVHFINATVQPLQTLQASITGGDSIPTVEVAPSAAADWSLDAYNRPLLALHLPEGAGDFSNYTLTLDPITAGQDTLIDRYFDSVLFSFKAFCPSDFDCATPPETCPPPDASANIDYTAKDFNSFVAALGAYSALNYPSWQERSKADFGTVMMEAMSALADEFSYYQDRVAAEATLATATQARSLVSLARLVDYEPAPTQSATTTLLCTVAGPGGVPAGVRVTANGADGGAIAFEIGVGLNDTTIYPASTGWNFPISAFWWDDSSRCLKPGATEMWVVGADHNFVVGMQLLIQTDLPGQSLRQIVTITEIEISVDKLYPNPQTGAGPPTPVTRLVWTAADKITDERNLTLTNVGGNLLPATQGLRITEAFAITHAPPSQQGARLAIARRGPNATDANPNFVYRWPLAQSPVAWLPPPPNAVGSPLTAANALYPEIQLQQTLPNTQAWTFSNSLLNALATETAFTVDPVAWVPAATAPDGSVGFYEMSGDNGESLRFGDGTFGQPPNAGDMFAVIYRVSAGSAGNVAADSIAIVGPAWAGLVTTARNPFAATGGADAETPTHIRNIAPYQFQAVQFRNVRPADYIASAETLSWVYRAGSAFRWTGSWFSAFTTADPEGGDVISDAEHLLLVELLNRRRLAGYESFCPDPVYVSLDLLVVICVAATATGPQVEAAVLAALSDTSGANGAQGFFFADRFTFGTPLYRSSLEAAIQAVPGVNGVLSVRYRQRGVTVRWRPLPEVFPLAPDRILRVENNPDYPDRGVLKIITEGGQ